MGDNSTTMQGENENETVEEAVFKYVQGLDVHEETDELWHGRATKRQRVDDDEEDELLSRETSLQLTLPASKRVQQYHEVLPKFAPRTEGNGSHSLRGVQCTYGDTVRRLTQQALSVCEGQRGSAMYTPAEDEVVDELVEAYCNYQDLTVARFRDTLWTAKKKQGHQLTEFWKSLYGVMGHRSEQSLYQHVRRRYHKFDKHRTWSAEDDETLWELCHDQGLEGRWSEVSKTLGRMPDDCRDRWRNYVKLRGSQRKNKWSDDEVARLKKIVAAVPTGIAVNWDKVSEQMDHTRSRLQCRNKWKYIQQRAELSPPPLAPPSSSQPDC